ncbi:hypothetical protein XENORESO_015589 [Xenotaenia resolanae]|uniref:Uncharacterized protein n=1 Tax=Xenotaenia resolanae TaxID=208358 RepID=A0ABV0WNA4_9TELE
MGGKKLSEKLKAFEHLHNMSQQKSKDRGLGWRLPQCPTSPFLIKNDLSQAMTDLADNRLTIDPITLNNNSVFAFLTLCSLSNIKYYTTMTKDTQTNPEMFSSICTISRSSRVRISPDVMVTKSGHCLNTMALLKKSMIFN